MIFPAFELIFFFYSHKNTPNKTSNILHSHTKLGAHFGGKIMNACKQKFSI